MSTIGVGNLGSVHLAGSVTGGQQAKPEKNQANAEASRQDFKATLEAISNQHSENVDEASLGADRDADGRRMDDGYVEPESQTDDETAVESSNAQVASVVKPQDPFGELGVSLDLEA